MDRDTFLTGLRGLVHKHSRVVYVFVIRTCEATVEAMLGPFSDISPEDNRRCCCVLQVGSANHYNPCGIRKKTMALCSYKTAPLCVILLVLFLFFFFFFTFSRLTYLIQGVSTTMEMLNWICNQVWEVFAHVDGRTDGSSKFRTKFRCFRFCSWILVRCN